MTDRTTSAEEGLGYEIRLDGHLGDHWSAWLGGLSIAHDDDGTSVLRGVVADQAALHGLLARIRDLGADLISIMPVGTGSPDSQPRQE